MNMSFKLTIWMLTTFAFHLKSPVSCRHDNDRVITINDTGISTIECCVYGKCYCSNLSLALEHIQSDTGIRIMSNISLHDVPQLENINDTNVTMEIFKNLTDTYEVFPFIWLHEFILQFSLIITGCLNNLYGPAQVFICCDDYSCDERYEYIVDSTHNNVTMISNDTITSCPISEACTFQLVATANINSNVVSIQIDIRIPSSNVLVGNCEEDIAHVKVSEYCLPLSCNLSDGIFFPEGIDCYGSKSYDYFTVKPGYWFSNGFTKYVVNCPQGHCDSNFDLNASVSHMPLPKSNNQCSTHWTGLACGECDKDHYIIHDSTSCVPSEKCTLKDSSGVILFFFASLLYWIIVISLIFVLLRFKLDITAGYAYGIIFYYSVLEQTVNASYNGTHNNFNAPIIITFLTILSSIGNMKPPFQLLKLCFWKNAKMMDHMFLTYIHPVVVTCLIVTIFILARNFVAVARTIGRYVNSKSICILLMLSYSSVSYTSVQLFRPLGLNNEYQIVSWHLYLSPTVKYFDVHDSYFKYMIIYFITAILCELIIGIGFPLFLAFQRYLTRYCNINFIIIKPIMDQLKGCYKEEYRWFAAYYLLCRQVIYAVDISTDFLQSSYYYLIPNAKFPIMLTVYILILLVHIWFQPYKERKLNVLDSCILMTLMLVFIGEHTTYGSTVTLWILPVILFINCVALSTKFKYVLIPISCLGMIALSCLTVFVLPDDYFDHIDHIDYQIDLSFYSVNFVVIIPIASLLFLAYMIYLRVIVIERCCKPRVQHRLINEQNEDSYEDSDSNEVI